MATLSDVLAQIRQHESGGNYGLTPQQNVGYPASHASGAYQFQPGTWQQWTAASGIGTQYSEAYLAPPNIQDAVAAYAAMQGPGVNSPSLWGGGGITYPAITSVDVTPQQLASGTGGTGSTSTDPLDPFNAQPGEATAPPGMFQTPAPLKGLLDWWSGLGEILTRVVVFVFGMGLVFLAIAALFWKAKTSTTKAFA